MTRGWHTHSPHAPLLYGSLGAAAVHMHSHKCWHILTFYPTTHNYSCIHPWLLNLDIFPSIKMPITLWTSTVATPALNSPFCCSSTEWLTRRPTRVTRAWCNGPPPLHQLICGPPSRRHCLSLAPAPLSLWPCVTAWPSEWGTKEGDSGMLACLVGGCKWSEGNGVHTRSWGYDVMGEQSQWMLVCVIGCT